MKEISVVRQILEWNEDKSCEIKKLLSDNKILMINIMGSPGAGKTSLIEALCDSIGDRAKVAVIEGDVAGKLDAERLSSKGIEVVQLNTDGACHIEAMSVQTILPMFDLNNTDIIFIENIGNLVCPVEFELGEGMRLAVLSVPEGDDKIEKYPLLFARCDVLAISKFDVKSVFDFDMTRISGDLRRINPKAQLAEASVRTGQGIDKIAGIILDRLQEIKTL